MVHDVALVGAIRAANFVVRVVVVVFEHEGVLVVDDGLCKVYVTAHEVALVNSCTVSEAGFAIEVSATAVAGGACFQTGLGTDQEFTEDFGFTDDGLELELRVHAEVLTVGLFAFGGSPSAGIIRTSLRLPTSS